MDRLTLKTIGISLWSELHLLRGELRRVTDILSETQLASWQREKLGKKWEAAREGEDRSVQAALQKLDIPQDDIQQLRDIESAAMTACTAYLFRDERPEAFKEAMTALYENSRYDLWKQKNS